MKILVVPSWYPPNGGRFFRLQAEALAQLGHQVDVLVLHEKGLSQKVNQKITANPSKLVNEHQKQFYRIPKLNTLNTNLFIAKWKRMLSAYLKQNKPDIIHVHSAVWAGVVVADLAKEFNIPYVLTEHRTLFFESKFPFSLARKKEIVTAFTSAKKIIAVSKTLQNKLESFCEQKLSAAVIPNMIDTSFYTLKPKRMPSDTFHFLSIGNLIHSKGFDILLESFALLAKTNKQIKLHIVGEGKEKEDLIRQAETLKIADKVNFCGYLTKADLLKKFHEVDAFVSPSRVEPFGVVIIEALSCGLPIVVTASGGPQDIVNEKNGYLAESENANSLHFYMNKILANYSTFDLESIRKHTVATYSKSVLIKAIEKELKACLNKKQ